MAYPQRAAVATSNEPSNTTTHTITLPSGIVSGSLVLVFVGTDGDISWSNLNGFTELFKLNNGTAGSCSVMYKYCSGGETTVDFISNESEVSTHISWRITGDAGSGRIPEVSTGVATNDQYPNPDLLTPTGGAKDYLWIAVEGNDDDDACTAYPLPDNNATNIDSGGCGVGVCSDELNQVSLDPGVFTLAGTEQWVACTVVVHPVGLTYKTLAGTIGGISSISDAPLKRVREFVSVAVTGVSDIVDAPLKRLREFVGETVTGVSGIVDVTFGRIRKFIGETVTGVSDIVDAPLTKLKGFVGETVQGISSLLGDITVTAGAVVKAFIGSIGAISGIADAPLKRIREYIGSVGGVSGIADVPLKRLRKFIGSVAGECGEIIRIDTEVVQNSAQTSSASITVPSDCTYVLLFGIFWYVHTDEPTYLRINSVDLSKIVSRIAATSGNVFCYALANPSTGSQTFSWSYPYSVSEGSHFCFVYLKGVDLLSPVRDSDGIGGMSEGNFTLTTVLRDACYIGAYGFRDADVNTAPVGSGQVEIIDTDEFHDCQASVGEEVASGLLTTLSYDSGDYSISVGCSLKPSSGIVSALSTIKSFIGKLAGLETVYEWVAGQPSPSQGKIDWVAGQPFVEVKYGQPESSVKGVFKRLRGFIGEVGKLADKLVDGGLNIWTSATNLTNWTEEIAGSSTINREALEKVEGEYSCRFDVDVSNNNVAIASATIVLTSLTIVEVSFWYKMSVVGKTAKWRIKDTGSNVFLSSSGIWVGSNTTINLPNQTNWTKMSMVFTVHPDYTDYILGLFRSNASDSSIYFDDVSIRELNSQVNALLSRVTGFISTTVEGISSVLADITVILGGGVKAFIGAVGGISDVLGNITGTFSLSGSVGAVSGVADTVLKRLRKFVGVSIDVVSNIVDAPFKRARKFIGETIGGLSGVSGVLKVLKKFVGVTVEGISSITGLFTTLGTVLFQGLVGAVSGVSGNILVAYVLNGVSGAISGVDGVLKRGRKFIGVIGSLSGVDAVFGRVRKFVGEAVQGISSVLGNIQKGAIKAFIGTIGVVSNIADAPLKILREFIGGIGSTSGVSGALSVIYKFIGETVQGVSSVLGELSKLGTVLLKGTIGAISAVDGVLRATFSLKGSIGSASEILGALKYTASFSGLVEALSGFTGTITTAATVVFQGVIGSFSGVVGSIKRSRGFTATISSLSGVDAVMKRIRAYIASVNVFSGVNGILKRLRTLSGSVLSTTAVDGYVKILYRFIGSIASASIITATIGRVKKFVGVTISAVSSVAGDLWAGVLYIFPIIFTVAPRIKAFLIEARDRIFKSDINKDR